MTTSSGYTALTGNEFYKLVNQVIIRRGSTGELPPLDQYLSSLWHLTSQYNDGILPRFTFSMVADWLDQAFDYPPMIYDWQADLKQPYVWSDNYETVAGTEARQHELRSYNYFERTIKRQISELKRGFASHPEAVPSSQVVWQNGTVDGFLERAVCTYEGKDDVEDLDDFYGWYDLVSYLHAGQWTE
ncbi:hypothetical protein [uncultured Fibrella sp.]|uniref:hypothetical protein n=1 Tax=uncultured Fibrella sp. TaxID=1284596 RepID=UPI0035CA9A07